MHHISKASARTAALAALAVAPLAAQAGWTNVPLPPGVEVYVSSARVCKTAVNSIYGTLWRANFQVFRSDSRVSRIIIWTVRNGNQTVNVQFQNQWLYGVVAGTGGQVFASPFHDDAWNFQVDFNQAVWNSHHHGYMVGASFDFRPKVSTIAYC